MLIRGLIPAFLCFSLFLSTGLFGQDAEVTDVPFHAPRMGNAQPLPDSGVIQQVAGPADAIGKVQPAVGGGSTVEAGSNDSKLGHRRARITPLPSVPQDANQIGRTFDLSPYTKGRTFPTGSNPSQTIVDWILRQTGTKLWHTTPFGFLAADEDKLHAYHVKEVMDVVADIVDRFINQQAFNEAYTFRVVALSQPDWITKGHTYLRPIQIRSPGVQGWILEKEGTQLLFQELNRRNDFVDLSPQQFSIPNGIAHHVESRRQRTYLRDVQPNPSALNGYAEDRVTIDEGFSVTFVPLACLDGQTVDAIIKLDLTLIEKMIPLMIEAPTQANPRQRIQIEAPQVACFQLDEQIRWPKNKVLLLDLGTVPIPPRQASEKGNLLTNINKALGQSSRANVLLFIEQVGTLSSPIVSGTATNSQSGQTPPTVGATSSYWQSVRK